ncbi:hypothetical protein AVEN_270488-1 [Araneus ventricosus]|uniref:Mos1 transposase HTH domain-containing protein n=1 Tax=Araneus ventricosus TaxID=182803 RepID=A0A4Y2B4E4_ARAVE|nr:hypothetical protein AVEN_270488-1 [Araneus ventricosus]
MSPLTDTWSAIEVRSIIRFLRLKKISPAEMHCQLVEVYGASVMSRKQVWFGCKEFELNRKNVQDKKSLLSFHKLPVLKEVKRLFWDEPHNFKALSDGEDETRATMPSSKLPGHANMRTKIE